MPTTLNLRDDQTTSALRAALAELANSMTSGLPRTAADGKPMRGRDGRRLHSAGFSTSSMDCWAVDALAQAFLISGHRDAAVLAIASHAAEGNDDQYDDHQVDSGNEWPQLIEYAENYTDTLVILLNSAG